MLRFLIELWPALLPLAIYLLWYSSVRSRAVKQGEAAPRFRDGPWYWFVLASAAIVAVILLAYGLTADPHTGTYTPPHVENGKIVPGTTQ